MNNSNQFNDLLKRIPYYKYVVIGGVTCSGKSNLAAKLARVGNGALINCDSVQLYKDLRILSDRPDVYGDVPHFLYGCLQFNENSNVAIWEQKASLHAEQSLNDGLLPIFVGGTGMYISALYSKIANIPSIHPEIIANSLKQLEKIGKEQFWQLATRVDPKIAANLNRNDLQRILRAYHVFQQTNKSIFDWHKESQLMPAALRKDNSLLILILPQGIDALRKKALMRIDGMLKNGAIDEVISLRKKAGSEKISGTLSKAIGFSEICDYLDCNSTLPQTKEKIAIATNQYIKRQNTWFKQQYKNWPNVVILQDRITE